MGFFPIAVSIDIELTNRCNANCHFCPRDQTPHQGLMSPEVFDKTLERAIEYRDGFGRDDEVRISLCGLGEPLLNKHAASFVAKVRAAGFRCSMSSNASLLDERRGRALLDAGLQEILINVSDVGDDYQEIYDLPFEKTYENVVRFNEMAGDDCEVTIVLVDHRVDPAHLSAMEAFWREVGVTRFLSYDVINRGGALFVDHMQYEQYAETTQARAALTVDDRPPLCGAPFAFQFVGYDGQHYLCCSDWKKEAPLGSVFEESFESVFADKLTRIKSREPVCKTCNLDPINRLTDALRGAIEDKTDPAEVDALVHRLVSETGVVHRVLAAVGVDATAPAAVDTRRRIPVQAL